MTRQMKTPIKLFLIVSAKRLGETTSRIINDPGNSNQSGKCRGKKRRSTTEMKAIQLPTSPLNTENITEGRLKNIYGIKREVSMFVFQFVRSSINRYIAAAEAKNLKKVVPNPKPLPSTNA